MKEIIIIGGGIIGLSSAFYLQKAGYKVSVLDKSNFQDNCSYGNAGYVCPSHFIPLATPGIVRQGFKWMFNSQSPFYVQPRLSWSLMDWGWQFIKSATREHSKLSAIPLRDISLFSQGEYEYWSRLPGFEFAYEHKGLLEIFQTHAAAEHARHTVEQARALGLNAELLNPEQLKKLEPQTTIRGAGAAFYKSDTHLYPDKLMKVLIQHLRDNGVQLLSNEEVKNFGYRNGLVNEVFTTVNTYQADTVILAAGAWSRELATLLKVRLPLVPGRGYSVTLENSPYHLNHPAVLVEGRVAITPMDSDKIRFGGTMEITGINTPPRINRVQGILNTVKRYFPEFNIALPARDKIWYGYRPCSADGLPYIGRIRNLKNVIVATGHAMLGLSLGAGTGKLVSELVNEEPPSIELSPFSVERFS